MIAKVTAAALMLTGLSACFDGPHVLTQNERLSAEISARRFAEAGNERFAGCYPKDDNGDGVVTCTVATRETGEKIELLCGYRESKIGCKRRV